MSLEIVKNRKISFDMYSLKIIAITAMVIDHVGCIFFSDLIIFRIIGRLTLPIMAFFITEGYRKTSNIKKYMVRLGIFALITMLPYRLAFGSSFFNILFNLLFGLIVLYITDKLHKEWQKWIIVVLFAFSAFFMHFDGMYTAVPLIYLMNKYRDNFKKMFISVAILLFGISVIQAVLGITGIDSSFLTNIFTWIRPWALISFIFIYKYNGQKGKDIKYFFYAFYPAHLLVLYLVHVLLSIL